MPAFLRETLIMWEGAHLRSRFKQRLPTARWGFYLQVKAQPEGVMTDIWQRTRLLLGDRAIEKLQQAHILVIGLGGVGSYAAEAVTRAGIGCITIVDSDRIEISNLNRQLPATHSSLGEFKTRAMAARMLDINPDLDINLFTLRYHLETSSQIFANQSYDYVMDAIDSLPDKLHLIKTCVQQGIPMVSCMGAANRVDPRLLTVADISRTSICPMARKVRRELRKNNIHQGVDVVFSRENPKPLLGTGPGLLGSLVTVTASAGLLMAAHAIDHLIAFD
jgi:tRNA A37 threonylcarbamoyladenosine dehydratase